MNSMVTPTDPAKSIIDTSIIKQKRLGIDKADADVIDLLRSFHDLQLQKHDLDKIKTDERVAAADYAIKTTSKKLNLCMLIIETMLKERMKFIQSMQLNEINMLDLIQQLLDQASVEYYAHFQQDVFEQTMGKYKQIIYSCYPLFNQLNHIILNLEQLYLHDDQWREKYKTLAKGMPYIQNLMDLNLIDVANALYHKFKKFNQQLISISGEEAENYVLNDEQIQKLMGFLMSITEEFVNNSAMHLRLIAHIWLEDIIRVQSGFQNNLSLYFNFIGKFEGTVKHYLLSLQNIEFRFKDIHYKNLKAQKILKRVVLPQKYDNDNLNMSIQIQEIINENVKNIEKTKAELEIEIRPQVIIFDVHDPDETFKPIGAFKGALKIAPKPIVILEAMMQDRRAQLRRYLNENLLELDSVSHLFSFFKELLIAEKKLFKAQSVYTNIKATLENARTSKLPINVQELHEQTLQLQKYTNYLSEQGQKAQEVADQMPKINDFTGLIQRFIIKAQFLVTDAVGIVG